MLNGIDPILIFSFFKSLQDTTESKIPLATELGLNRLALPPIPIYLSEAATGIYIDSEDKSLDIETNIETLRNASGFFTQKGIGSTISVTMHAKKGSLALTLLSAVSDLILAKVTSKEYSVTYLHGAITIFNGLLHEFTISQNADNDLYEIKLTLMRAPEIATSTFVPNSVNGTSILNSSGVATGGTLPNGSSFTSSGAAPIPLRGAP